MFGGGVIGVGMLGCRGMGMVWGDVLCGGGWL